MDGLDSAKGMDSVAQAVCWYCLGSSLTKWTFCVLGRNLVQYFRHLSNC
jgi:hypothetical protein